MEQGLVSRGYIAFILQIGRGQKGTAAFKAIVDQNAGVDVWEKRISNTKNYMNNRKRYGTTKQTLPKRINRHMTCFVAISRACNHVLHKLLAEQTW